jgi:hypothetical protein
MKLFARMTSFALIKLFGLLSLFLFALAARTPIASADTVDLKNGDRLTGTISGSDAKQLSLKTDFAGEIKINWSAIKDVSSPQPLFVSMKDRTVSGTVAVEPSDLVVHTPDHGDVHVPLADTTVVRAASEQKTYEASLHPDLLHAWKGGVNLGLALARGNSDTTNLNTGITAVRKTSDDQISVYESSVYATSTPPGGTSSSTTASEVLGGARWDRDIRGRLFGFISADYTHDALQALNLRSIYSLGIGAHVIKEPNTSLDLFAGGNYTRETYGTGANLTGGVPTNVAVERNLGGVTLGESFTHKFPRGSVFNEHLFFYPDLTETGQYRIALDGGMVTKISKWLGWQWSISDRYVSNPPIVGTKPNDLIISTGLNVSFSR